MQKYFLGIDIGTGSTKSIAVDEVGKAFSVVHFHYPTISEAPGFSEQDSEVIWKAFEKSIISHVQKLQQAPEAVCLSSAMHSIIPVDEQGRSLANMMTWADGRSGDIADRIKNSDKGEELYKVTGTPLHAMSPLCKIIWLRENERNLFDKTFKFIGVKEFIWYRLFSEFIIDHSIASATGLFEILSCKWHGEALELAGIRENQLSAAVSTTYSKNVSDFACSGFDLLSNVPFIVGASDGCLANVGSFVTNDNTAAVTIGTSGAVRINSKKPMYNYKVMTFNYRLDENNFVCGGPINNGGNTLQWFIKNLLEKETFSDEDYAGLFNKIEKIETGAEGLVFLPYLNGERAPYWDIKSSGSFFGIKSKHTADHFARAVVEGVCFALYNVLQIFEVNGNHIDELNVSGGFVTSDVWLQILADITGKKVHVFQTEDASAIGAAYFAMHSLNFIEDYQSLKKSDKLIEPNPPDNIKYKSYFSIFRELYVRTNDLMHELHNLNKTQIVG